MKRNNIAIAPAYTIRITVAINSNFNKNNKKAATINVKIKKKRECTGLWKKIVQLAVKSNTPKKKKIKFVFSEIVNKNIRF